MGNKEPVYATLTDTFGEPRARVKVIRRYASVVKVKRWLGEGWGEVEDAHPGNVVDDGGKAWGWDAPASQEAPEKSTLTGQRVAYMRVSSTDQNLARQKESVGEVDRTFTDKFSGKSTTGRTGLREALDYVRAGDTLVVASIDRLARSLTDLRKIVDEVVDKGATVEFVHEHMTFSADRSDPRSMLMLSILGSFAEFERSIIHERQAEGIALAKKKGKYKGGQPKLSAEQVEEVRQRVAANEGKSAIARDLGVSRQTIYRALDGAG
ncbi:MAG: recombinase family protein [Corynebacterium sp.]|uniref:recombinase family protein n=1 Tax=Corynebacterium sp. TaxID=1720 RepID=UPI003F0F75AD